MIKQSGTVKPRKELFLKSTLVSWVIAGTQKFTQCTVRKNYSFKVKELLKASMSIKTQTTPTISLMDNSDDIYAD